MRILRIILKGFPDLTMERAIVQMTYPTGGFAKSRGRSWPTFFLNALETCLSVFAISGNEPELMNLVSFLISISGKECLH
jgi:hypothetical protein